MAVLDPLRGEQASARLAHDDDSREMPGGAGNYDDDLHDWPSFIGVINSSDSVDAVKVHH